MLPIYTFTIFRRQTQRHHRTYYFGAFIDVSSQLMSLLSFFLNSVLILLRPWFFSIPLNVGHFCSIKMSRKIKAALVCGLISTQGPLTLIGGYWIESQFFDYLLLETRI